MTSAKFESKPSGVHPWNIEAALETATDDKATYLDRDNNDQIDDDKNRHRMNEALPKLTIDNLNINITNSNNRKNFVLSTGSVCLNSRLAAAKWISAMVMLQPGLAAAQ